MLLKQAELAGIASGEITAVFRRWRQARVKTGSTLRTAIGVVAVDKVEPMTLAAITDRSARDAGYADRAELRAALSEYDDGQLYRIHVHFAGDDPRVVLRRQADLSDADAKRLAQRLARLGAKTDGGPWALSILRLIAARPAVRAADLAKQVGMDTAHFKPRVRQLKELG